MSSRLFIHAPEYDNVLHIFYEFTIGLQMPECENVMYNVYELMNDQAIVSGSYGELNNVYELVTDQVIISGYYVELKGIGDPGNHWMYWYYAAMFAHPAADNA